MCLYYDKGVTQALRARKGAVVGWKILNLNENELYSITYSGAPWKAGVNRSNRKYRRLSLTEKKAYSPTIDAGIHVYLVKPTRGIESRTSRLVPVQCLLRDLIGVNGPATEAVFMKVILLEADYRAATQR